jgi:hypothetical protein
MASLRGRFLDTMISLANDGMTMICVTHEMGFARQVPDRVVFMANGSIVEEAPPVEFFRNPKSERTRKFLGEILAGHSSFESECSKFAEDLGIEFAFHQSNFEGAIVELIQSGRDSADAIIINPAGYSFTSIAIIDAMKIFAKPIIELHISNISCARRVAQALDIVERGDRGHLRVGSLWLHHCDAGGSADPGQTPGNAAELLASAVPLNCRSPRESGGQDRFCLRSNELRRTRSSQGLLAMRRRGRVTNAPD